MRTGAKEAAGVLWLLACLTIAKRFQEHVEAESGRLLGKVTFYPRACGLCRIPIAASPRKRDLTDVIRHPVIGCSCILFSLV